ncbi:MAG: MBL fold metallo-hydrolase [Proteobacteria bacterium]|nr:MBL fold metallo-hydrolase [Pseudomonadota bacterium]
MNKVFDEFTLHKINGHISTIFLAVYPDKILILDGGCRNDVWKIESYITRKLNRNMSSVKLVVASHAHPDHAGGSPEISRKYGLKLAAPRAINKWYKGPWGFIQHKIDTLLGFHVARATGKPFENIFYPRKVFYDYPLDDSALLPGFEDWIVFHSPGHTNHDIVLYNENARLLYAADVILCVNGKMLLPFPVPLEDKMTTSLDRISDLKVETLLLAHGGVMKVDGMRKITRNLQGQLYKGLPPLLEKLKILESFSPEIRKEKKRKKAA